MTEAITVGKSLTNWRGFRNILNWDEGAEVNMDPAVTSNRFIEQPVKDNFKVMEAAGASFEFMLNPHQINSEEYWEGMRRFQKMPKVYMKISFFARTDAEWKQGDQVIAKSIELIKLFGPNRCMFATNFPVDNADLFGTWTMKDMLKTFHTIAKEFTPAEQARLWRETAIEAYRMGDIVKC